MEQLRNSEKVFEALGRLFASERLLKKEGVFRFPFLGGGAFEGGVYLRNRGC